MTMTHHILVFLTPALFLLPVFQDVVPPSPLETTHWLTDEQARDTAAAAIRAVRPEPCYSTYRNERLESFLLSVRRNPTVGKQLNNSVYFYRVASDSCSYVVEKDGKTVLMSRVSMDCCEYGLWSLFAGCIRNPIDALTGERKAAILAPG